MSGFRLSPQQRRLFELDRAEGVDNRVQAVFRLAGDADPLCFEAAVRSAVERHEILRTAFPNVAGLELPVQEPHDPWTVEMVRHDLTGADPEETNHRIDGLRQQRLAEEHDPVDARLLELDWLRLGSSDHLLLWTQPALWGDPESVVNLWRQICEAASADEASAEEPMQYADVAEWLNEILEADDADEGLTYWRRRHAALPRISFPLATDVVPSSSYRSRLTAVPVDSAATEQLMQWSTDEDCPLDAVLVTLWSAVLARYCDCSTVAIDVYFDGRSYEGLDEAVGLFGRYLPIAVDLGGSPSVRGAARQLAPQLDAAADWQEYYCRERIESAGAVLPFGYEARRLPEEETGGVSWRAERLDANLEPHLARLHVRRSDGDLTLELVTDAARLPTAAAEQVAAALGSVVSAAARAADAPVDELPLVPPEHEAMLASEWGTTVEAEPPEAVTVLELIREHVARDEEAIAVVDPDGSASYRQLWDRSGAIAAHLEVEGLGSGDVVAICCRRSIEMVAAILGVLRAGAAYLPLDPGYPPERLSFMAADSAAGALLGHGPTIDLASEIGVRTVDLDEVTRGGEPAPGLATDLAYVIYTSGSTGRPKGVGVTHRNLLYSTFARRLRYDEAPERFLLLSSYAFDSSMVGLFWTLTSGATLVLPADGTEQDTAALSELVAAEKITHTLCLPTLYGLLLDQADVGRLASLRHVIVAGEVCPPRLLDRHAALRPDATLVNEYGPTEATVWATSAVLRADDSGSTTPIGDAVPYARVDLLDPRGRVVPPGIAGEIAIGGEGVARGYVDHPRLTAERFRPDPYSSRPGARNYRTGDRGRRRVDGQIDFLGRLDNQVKIRGVRVEPEEVEARLGAHSGIERAVVVPRGDDSGRLQLVAYLVCGSESEPSVSDLRDHLQQDLPEPMIPARFIFLDALPLAPNGKVDREALPEPSEARPDLAAEYVEPESILERYLVEQWRAVLQAETIGVLDNFFELGGNSIQAAIFMNRLRGDIDEFVHVGRLFEHPTIRGLAQFLSEEHATAISRLDGDREERPRAERAEVLERLDRQTLERLEELSDDEVDSMLDELLSQEEASS